MLWPLVRPLAFCLPAEPAHYFTMGVFSFANRVGFVRSMIRGRMVVKDPRLTVSQFGLSFANPVGLAAGFDKDARWHNELANLGFSHIEVGTITGQSQPGNPKPRLFRLKRDRALINRMGFNNQGSENAAANLAVSTQRQRTGILGINIGKTKVVPLGQATDDYLLSFQRLFQYADYFTINVSSPNTPGLRQLQDREPLIELIQTVMNENDRLSREANRNRKPVLLKIAPDMSDEQLVDIASIARETKLSGIIATNTTIERSPLSMPPSDVDAIGAGGLSGTPLTQRSRQVIARLYELTDREIPLVGVGGIMNGEDAWQMILAGASLIQVYTGFVYGGPGMVREINRYLLNKLAKNNLSNIIQAVGGYGKLD